MFKVITDHKRTCFIVSGNFGKDCEYLNSNLIEWRKKIETNKNYTRINVVLKNLIRLKKNILFIGIMIDWEIRNPITALRKKWVQSTIEI